MALAARDRIALRLHVALIASDRDGAALAERGGVWVDIRPESFAEAAHACASVLLAARRDPRVTAERDRLAEQMLVGLVIAGEKDSPEEMVASAYRHADAQLAVRGKARP